MVEVLSPSDRASKVKEKVRDWLAAGVRLVWVVDPRKQLARVYREDGAEATVTGDQTLDAEPVLPGFRCGLAEVFRVTAIGREVEEELGSNQHDQTDPVDRLNTQLDHGVTLQCPCKPRAFPSRHANTVVHTRSDNQNTASEPTKRSVANAAEATLLGEHVEARVGERPVW